MRFTLLAGGPGNGHTMRCNVLALELESRGHEVHSNAKIAIVDPGAERFSIAEFTHVIGLDSGDHPDVNYDIVTGFDKCLIPGDVLSADTTQRGAYTFVAPYFDLSGDGYFRAANLSRVDYVSAMAGAESCVTNGGLTMLEAMSMGKRVWVIPRSPSEFAFALRALDMGAICGIGCEVPPSCDWADTSPTARTVVARDGAQLVADEILEVIGV